MLRNSPQDWPSSREIAAVRGVRFRFCALAVSGLLFHTASKSPVVGIREMETGAAVPTNCDKHRLAPGRPAVRRKTLELPTQPSPHEHEHTSVFQFDAGRFPRTIARLDPLRFAPRYAVVIREVAVAVSVLPCLEEYPAGLQSNAAAVRQPRVLAVRAQLLGISKDLPSSRDVRIITRQSTFSEFF